MDSKDSKKKRTLLLSCNPIINPEDGSLFETGVYGESLVVVSLSGDGSLMRISDIPDFLWDKEIEEVFLYLAGFSPTGSLRRGRNGETTRALLNTALDRAKKERVHLVGCPCNLQKKEIFAKELGLDFLNSDHGGILKLGKIAADVLKGR